jgi:hypothetical protein
MNANYYKLKETHSFLGLMNFLLFDLKINKETLAEELYFFFTGNKFSPNYVKNNSLFILNEFIKGFKSMLIVLVDSNIKSPKYFEIAGIENLNELMDFIFLNFEYKNTIDQKSRDNIYIILLKPKIECNFFYIEIISRNEIIDNNSLRINDNEIESIILYF